MDDMQQKQEESFENLEKEYTFRIDGHDHDIAEEETLEKSMSSIRWHAIGIGLLIGVLVAVLITVFIMTFSEEPKEPAVLVSSMGEVKTRPAEVGGMDIPDQDKLVYQRMRSSDLNTAVVKVVSEEEHPLPPPVIPMEEEEITEVEEAIEPPPELPVRVVEEKPAEPVAPPVVEKKEPAKAQPKAQPKAEAKAEKAPAPAKVTATPKWRAQLASMSSKADAEKAWNPMVKKHSVVLSGVSHQVIKATTANKKTVYRLVAGAFDSKKQAQDFCAKLKARGQDCIPVQ